MFLRLEAEKMDMNIKKHRSLVFPVIDCSGSMNLEGRMTGVNESMREVIDYLARLDRENDEVDFFIAPIIFSTGAECLVEQPASVLDYKWQELEANGVTDLGSALNILDQKLKAGAFMSDNCYAPIIVFIMDGFPVDDWTIPFARLKKNGWYRASLKIAIAIGDDAGCDILEEIVGNEEAVFKIDSTKEVLSNLIKRLIRCIRIPSGCVISSDEKSVPSNNEELSLDEMTDIFDDFD